MSNARKPLAPTDESPDPGPTDGTAYVDTEGVEDFDAFWETADRKCKVVRIKGEDITLPPSIPLQYEFEAKKAATSESDEDVRRLVAILTGSDRVEAWAEKGMDLEQFQVLLYWLPLVIEGSKITLAEAAATVRGALAAPDPTKRQKRRKR